MRDAACVCLLLVLAALLEVLEVDHGTGRAWDGVDSSSAVVVLAAGRHLCLCLDVCVDVGLAEARED